MRGRCGTGCCRPGWCWCSCLACWLFMRSGYGQVMGKIADAQVLNGLGGWQMPTTSSLTKARVRLGPEPARLLFERVAGPVGGPGTPGVFWLGRRVVTMDGFTCDVPDTEENAEHFGRGANGSGAPNPYPQLRAVALAEGGTRSLLAVRHGPYTSGEQTLATDLAGALGPGDAVPGRPQLSVLHPGAGRRQLDHHGKQAGADS